MMRGFLPFLRLDLARPVLPCLLAQDAAGGGEDAGPNGSFFLAAGFPSLQLMEQIWAWRDLRGAVVGSLSEEGANGPAACGALGVVQRLAAERDGRSAGWIPFTGVPTAALCKAAWFRILSGLWIILITSA